MGRHCVPKSDARAIAAWVVAEVADRGAYASVALSSALKLSDLDPRDKAFCTELVYGTLRWYLPLQRSIRRAQNGSQKIDRRIMPHLAVAAYQLQHLSETIPAHAAVHGAVDQIKKVHRALGNFANAILRNLGSAEHLLLASDCNDVTAYAQAFGLPMFFAEELCQRILPNQWFALFSSLNARPHTYLREFVRNDSRLMEDHAFVPNAFRMAKSSSVSQIPGFLDGECTVQDPASQIAALLVNAKSGDLVIDMCAAPGTKSVVLGKQTTGVGKVVAIDIHEAKASLIAENSARMKVPVEIRIGDAKDIAKEFAFMADAVLLDAPCSSLGTTRRHPEVKLRRKSEDLLALTKLQDELLETASGCIKPGGTLVYSVCSPLLAEGHERITSFLTRHPEFTRELASETLPWLPNDAQNRFGEILLWPHLHDADAFFAVRLKKS